MAALSAWVAHSVWGSAAVTSAEDLVNETVDHATTAQYWTEGRLDYPYYQRVCRSCAGRECCASRMLRDRRATRTHTDRVWDVILNVQSAMTDRGKCWHSECRWRTGLRVGVWLYAYRIPLTGAPRTGIHRSRSVNAHLCSAEGGDPGEGSRAPGRRPCVWIDSVRVDLWAPAVGCHVTAGCTPEYHDLTEVGV